MAAQAFVLTFLLASCYAIGAAVITPSIAFSTTTTNDGQPDELAELFTMGLFQAIKAGDCPAQNNHNENNPVSTSDGGLWYYTTSGTDVSNINNCTLSGPRNTTYYTSETTIASTTTIISIGNSTSCDKLYLPPFYQQTMPNPRKDIVAQTVTATNQATVNTISRGSSNLTTEWNCFTGVAPATVLQKKEEKLLNVFSTSLITTTCNAMDEVVCYNTDPKVMQFGCTPMLKYCTEKTMMCIPAGAQGGGFTDAILRMQLCSTTDAPTTTAPTMAPTTAPTMAPTTVTTGSTASSTPATTPQPGAATALTSSTLSILLAAAGAMMIKHWN